MSMKPSKKKSGRKLSTLTKRAEAQAKVIEAYDKSIAYKPGCECHRCSDVHAAKSALAAITETKP